MFGTKWTANFGDSDSGTWLKVLDGLTPEQLAAGLELVAKSGMDWPPGAPKFRSMCENAGVATLGLPDTKTAFYEAVSKSHAPLNTQWSHPSIYLAGKAVGWFDMKTAEPGSKTEERFARNYEILLRRVAAGEDLTAELPLALEDTRDKKRPLTQKDRETGAAALAQLKGIF